MCVDLQTQQDDIVENVEGLDVILTAGTDVTVDVSPLRVNISSEYICLRFLVWNVCAIRPTW